MLPRGARSRHICLAFDAFDTLFTPRRPVFVQYGEIARAYGISGFSDNELQAAFKQAFKDEARQHPNYGKAVGMKPPAWWANIICKTFRPFLRDGQPLPAGLVPDLLTRFSTRDGYTLFPDVMPFFAAVRAARRSREAEAQGSNQGQREKQHQGKDIISSEQLLWPWPTQVGIVTNSDDRVPGILRSFGLGVSARRAGGNNRDDDSISEAAAASGAGHEAHDVDFVVLSYDVGAEKPDRRIFDAARDLFARSLEEAEGPTMASAVTKAQSHETRDHELWYVGDDKEKDFRGAIAAGWKAVHLVREGTPNERFAAAGQLQEGIVTIQDLSELRSVIEQNR